ncbi:MULTISPECIES: nuclear transport factor 2 family protein [Nocardia]|uniref:Nuclear transport factor 2 family protein n=1 Tax=Nocardia aurea TaxID=2144174 RepID=A0ABV3G2N5_9NOCA|nr:MULTISPECIES: nuclear transport factor 2 family protein [Nocardia]
MSVVPEEVQALLDKQSIREQIVRLARGEDRRDAVAITASFWKDATTDFGIFSGSFDDYLNWVVPGSPAVILTQHMLGQTLVELDGDIGLAETYVDAYHRVDMGEGERDISLGGRYLDRFERRDGQWRIAKRTMLYDWVREGGDAADWSKGILGAELTGRRYIGRTSGDHSATFFGARASS